ncbi:MAG: ATP phosphoribosyltransferase [Pseudomonadota bacterium]
MSSTLTIALTKGRILKETLPLLKAAGIEPLEDIAASRKLIFDTNQTGVRLLILRGSDVTTYVRRGVADLGIAGKDMLLEYGGEELYELLDLDIARCQLMTAGLPDVNTTDSARIRVATKFVNVAQAYYAKKGVQADVIHLYGAMELAPIMGLADEIVDIVDTGNTLKANGLVAKEHIADVSSRLVANPSSYKLKHTLIKPLVSAFEDALT